jgi:hypothetical protein
MGGARVRNQKLDQQTTGADTRGVAGCDTGFLSDVKMTWARSNF